MNNNKQNQIRQGLTQFVGALIDNLSGDKEAVAQLVAASLSEEALKTSIKDNKINYFINLSKNTRDFSREMNLTIKLVSV